MPIVSITDYTFPSLDIEESLIRAAGCELRSGNDKQVAAGKPTAIHAECYYSFSHRFGKPQVR